MKQYGRAHIFGISGSLSYGAVVGYRLMESVNMSNTFDNYMLIDQSLEPLAFDEFRSRRELTIRYIPCAPSGTNTATQAKLVLGEMPAGLTKITLAGMDDANYNGDFIYMGGGTTELTKEGPAIMNLPAVQYISASSTTLTTQVTP